MKIISLISLILLFQITLTKDEGFIQFYSIGSDRECDERLEQFKFNIIADSLNIETGTSFNLRLSKPYYAYAVCEIQEAQII